jgi:sialate O-acetylesterase
MGLIAVAAAFLSASAAASAASAAASAACTVAFNETLGDNMVLQQQPAQAAVYGVVTGGASGVSVQVTDAAGGSYSVDATLGQGLWKALLRAAPAGGNYTIAATATCSAGGQAVAQATNVVMGDVWYCGGQSNMALPLLHTLTRNASLAAFAAGRYTNIRLQQMGGNMNPQTPWTPISAALDPAVFLGFSGTCYYFGESLTDALGAAAPPLGLIHTAWGGSTIQNWISNDTLNSNVCANHSSGQGNDGGWYESRVLPYAEMSLKGWIWYQVRCRLRAHALRSAEARAGERTGKLARARYPIARSRLSHHPDPF